MVKSPLTEKAVKALKPGKHPIEKYDALLPGFGVRVMPSGAKSWMVLYFFGTHTAGKQAGKPKRWRYTFGSVASETAGTGFTLKDARLEAMKLLNMVYDDEVNPAIARKMKRKTRTGNTGITFRDLLDEYNTIHLKHIRTGADVKASFEKHCADWMDVPAKDILEEDVIALCDRLIAAGSPVMAERMFAYIRAFYNWAISERRYKIISPCHTVKAPKKTKSRTRILTDDEIKWLWAGANALGSPNGALVQLLLVTGQRRGEVAEMTWNEVDLKKAVWTIPSARVKSDRPNVVPLSPLAVSILSAIPKPKGKKKKGDYVLSTTNGRRPISGFSKSKGRLDAAVLELKRETATANGEDPEHVQSMEPWRYHDLRRTCRTNLSVLKVPTLIAELVLNHSMQGLQATYDQYEYLDEKRHALESWANRLETILELPPPPDNVVKLHA